MGVSLRFSPRDKSRRGTVDVSEAVGAAEAADNVDIVDIVDVVDVVEAVEATEWWA
jgi:hypothetical protein